MSENRKFLPGIGLDVGTSFLQVARQLDDGTVQFISERDAFFAIKPSSTIQAKVIETGLKKRGTFILKNSEGNVFYVVGQDAIEIAIEKGGTVERPLKRGILDGSSLDSMSMLAALIQALIGQASIPEEPCVYSFPANPIDEDSFDVIYHQNRIAEILSGLGYNAVPLLESEALAYSELMEGEDDLTGLVVSCGAGMHNLSVFHIGENVVSFSIAHGGDYIDQCVSQRLQRPETEVQAVKEDNLDLLNPQSEIQKAIAIYYRQLVKYISDALEEKFKTLKEVPHFSKPIPVVFAGGTSMPKGYIEIVRDTLTPMDSSGVRKSRFPFDVSEIRSADNPLTAVANGCLIYAQMFGE